MTIALGAHQYGKAETRVVHVTRDPESGTHLIRDLNVSIALAGRLHDVYTRGDNSAALPTDSQKNTVYAFAREHGITTPEDFAVLLARHFVSGQDPIERARVAVEQFGWDRIPVTGHSFVRRGQEVRTARITHTAQSTHLVSGLRDLTVLNTTGSEFRGFPRDRYTTLQEASDRVLATSITAEWRHRTVTDWDASYAAIRDLLTETFAATYSVSLQQTLHAMGTTVLEKHDNIAEIRFQLPNKHHFLVDLSPFGLDNPDQVYVATDRPYGLIEGTVLREDVPSAEEAWWSF